MGDWRETNIISASGHGSVMGRHVVKEDHRICFDWPGVRVTFNNLSVTKILGVRMKAGRAVLGYRIASLSDSDEEERGAVVKESILNCNHIWNNVRDFKLAEDLDPAQRYKLEIWKRDDPGDGIVEIFGLLIDPEGTADDAAAATGSNRRHLEFVGDSDAVGFGNLAPKSGLLSYLCCGFQASCLGYPGLQKATDVAQAYPHFVSKALNADYSVIAKCGIGAEVSPFTSRGNMRGVYKRTLFSDPTSERRFRDLSSMPLPDAVIVYIGCNDQIVFFAEDGTDGFGEDDQEDIESRLFKAFTNLLQMIRRFNTIPGETSSPVKLLIVVPAPDAVLTRMMSKDAMERAAELQRSAWNRVARAMGGEAESIYIIENRHEPQIEFNSKRDFGMMQHWNASSCEKWANGMIGRLEQILNT